MKICGQCGETAAIGGFACLPGEDLKEVWRCMSCMMVDVKKHFAALGITNPKALIVRDAKERESEA
jgi:hypothetical protein